MPEDFRTEHVESGHEVLSGNGEAQGIRVPIEQIASLSRDIEKTLLMTQPGVLTTEISPETLQRMQQILDHLSPKLAADSSGAEPHLVDLPPSIGRYRVTKVLGRGGFAVVYAAHDPHLNREVAVKVPLPYRQLTPDARQRFLLEAQAAARLDHPHIVPTFETGSAGELPYITYALCHGPTLFRWLNRHGPLSPRVAAELVMQLSRAVAYSHQQGVLHRDLKSANVLLFPIADAFANSEEEFPFIPRLTDFGLAKVLEGTLVETCSSVIMGTPHYMAPEQLEKGLRGCTPATDVFGLGTILFECLTGKPPHQGDTVIEILASIREGEVSHVSQFRRDVPQDLVRVCDKALSFLPEDRYATPQELAQDLARFLSHESVLATGPNWQTRLWRAARHPARIADAAAFIIMSNLAIIAWITIFPISIVFGLAFTHSVELGQLMPHTAPLWVFHFLMVILGYLIGRKSLWAAMASTISGAVLTLFIWSVLARWITPPYPAIYSDDKARDIVFVLLLAIFGAQTILSACAWLALKTLSLKNRQPGAAS